MWLSFCGALELQGKQPVMLVWTEAVHEVGIAGLKPEIKLVA